VQLVEALCYKSEGDGFDSRRGLWISLIYVILPVLGSTQPLTEMRTNNDPWVIEKSRKRGSLDVSQHDGSPRPVTAINSVVLSQLANYTDRAIAAGQRS
jgi:hypothetical protein